MRRGFWLLILLWTAAAAAPANPWKAGVAKVDITPTVPVQMAGFGFRKHASEGVRQPIFVRALALCDSSDRTAVVVTFDLCMVNRAMAEDVAARCLERFGLPRDRLLMNVSHTHSGPVIGHMYGPPTEQKRKSTEIAVASAVSAVEAALRALQPATLEYAVGAAGIAVNRRRLPTFAGIPGGPIDPDVPVLAVRRADGSLLAIVTGYACHASALSDYLISNDWPGYALAEIDAAHPGALALFVQGCGADANALPRGDETLARGHGHMLAAEVENLLAHPMTPVTGPLLTRFDRVDVAFAHAISRSELLTQAKSDDRRIRERARTLLASLGDANHTPESYPYPIQIWRFGPALTLIGLSGEVVADYALRFKRTYGFSETWVAGYCSEIMSYVPSRRVLAEGGYEGGDAMIGFGHASVYRATIEETIAAKVDAMTRELAADAAGK